MRKNWLTGLGIAAAGVAGIVTWHNSAYGQGNADLTDDAPIAKPAAKPTPAKPAAPAARAAVRPAEEPTMALDPHKPLFRPIASTPATAAPAPAPTPAKISSPSAHTPTCPANTLQQTLITAYTPQGFRFVGAPNSSTGGHDAFDYTFKLIDPL
ncbi:MAG: hypothetical protein WAX89_05415, partial [Alphaproteobacteria bacterium]